MLFQSLILPGVLIPTIAAAAVYLAWTFVRKTASTSRGGASLALAAAFLSAFAAMTGWPRFPPVGSSQRLFYLVALLGAVGLVAGWRRRDELPWLVRGAIGGLLLGFMLQAKVKNSWSALEATFWLAGLFVAALAFFWALEKNLRQEAAGADLRSAAVRLALVGGTALILGLSGSARLAQLAGAVACGVFVVEVLARLRGRRPWLGADAAVLSAAIFGLLLSGYFYASLAEWPAVFLVIAFLLLALPRGRWSWLAPLLPLAAAAALVVAAFLTKEEDPYGYYGATNGAIHGAPRPVAPASRTT